MPLQSNELSGKNFSAAKFWLVRLLSIGVVILAAWIFQTQAVSHLGIYDKRLLVSAMTFAALAVSLNLINGVTGQFSMGHAAFYMIGAYTGAKLTTVYFDKHLMPNFAWLLTCVAAGAIVAAFAGWVVGLPSLRLRGDYLAIVTLGFGEILRVFVNNQDGSNKAVFGLNLGGSYALDMPRPAKITELAYIFVFLVITIAICRNLLKTAHGLGFLSIREDELAAEATGVNTTKLKVTAFVIGAALAGVAGVLMAHYNGSVTPNDYTMDVSFLLVTMVVMGGTGSFTGAAIAGISLKILEESLRSVPDIPAMSLWAAILTAVLFVALLKRTGLANALRNERMLPIKIIFGELALVVIGYYVFRLIKADMSIVFKISGALVFLGAVIAMHTRANLKSAVAVFGGMAMSLAAIILISKPVAALLHSVPLLEKLVGGTTYKATDVRWAFFAIALVVTMLVRSQGLFGHHEFSWSFVSKLFGRKHDDVAVAA
ncbi:MAG: branched-chain amino acid ABC transporter permease [Fimbriimonadales bacterium]